MNPWQYNDDSEPLPDWMNPETYRNPKPKFKSNSKSLNDTILEAMIKPPVPLIEDKEPKL
jgi:hypothetical protein